MPFSASYAGENLRVRHRGPQLRVAVLQELQRCGRNRRRSSEPVYDDVIHRGIHGHAPRMSSPQGQTPSSNWCNQREVQVDPYMRRR
jgi:hypothetical protein